MKPRLAILLTSLSMVVAAHTIPSPRPSPTTERSCQTQECFRFPLLRQFPNQLRQQDGARGFARGLAWAHANLPEDSVVGHRTRGRKIRVVGPRHPDATLPEAGTQGILQNLLLRNGFQVRNAKMGPGCRGKRILLQAGPGNRRRRNALGTGFRRPDLPGKT